jgi:two-component sensor histidine kinase
MDWRIRLPRERPALGRAILVGLAAAVVGALLRVPLKFAIGADLPFITFFPMVLVAAIWGGMAAGLACLCSSVAVYVAFLRPHADAAHLTWSLLVFTLSGGGLAWVGSALASSIRELLKSQRRLEAAEADLQTLVGELAHRSRNGLTVVMAIIRQSARKVETARELAEIVNARLGAMADAQDEVVRGGGDTAALRNLLERTLSPFDLGRFNFERSPVVQVGRETAAALALLTHELATNAVKHGALSLPDGQVQVVWTTAPDRVQLLWRERGGPPPVEPTTRGFGTRLLSSVLESHGGSAERRFEADGMVCEIAFPYSRFAESLPE